MHMGDALVSPVVGITMLAVSAGLIAYSTVKSRKNLDRKKIPMMGVMAALIFAGQMINFTIPVTGSSGHIGGGILLASILGDGPGFLALTAVLVIQAFFFADGGLLALGCNIFNMGFWPCLVVYPLITLPLLKNKITNKRLMLVSILSVVIALQAGSFSVVLETVLSGVTALPFKDFLLLMQPIHLIIAIVEGIVTGLVLIFVNNVRPEVLDFYDSTSEQSKFSNKKLTIILLIAAIIIGGGLSYFASENPDGLEWAIGNITTEEELGDGYDITNEIQDSTAIFPDYSLKDDAITEGISPAVLWGGIITIVLVICAGVIASYIVKRRKR